MKLKTCDIILSIPDKNSPCYMKIFEFFTKVFTRSKYVHGRIIYDVKNQYNIIVEAIHPRVISWNDPEHSFTDSLINTGEADIFRFNRDLTQEEISNIQLYLRNSFKKKYDIGAIFDFVTFFHTGFRKKEKVFCFELIIEAFKFAGITISDKIPSKSTGRNLSNDGYLIKINESDN